MITQLSFAPGVIIPSSSKCLHWIRSLWLHWKRFIWSHWKRFMRLHWKRFFMLIEAIFQLLWWRMSGLWSYPIDTQTICSILALQSLGVLLDCCGPASLRPGAHAAHFLDFSILRSKGWPLKSSGGDFGGPCSPWSSVKEVIEVNSVVGLHLSWPILPGQSQPCGTWTCPETFAIHQCKHGHVLAVVSVRPVFARISWLFQDELRHWIFTKVSPLRPQRTMTGSGRRGCCRFEPSPHLPWTKLEAHTAKLHFGVHLALHHLGFVVLKLFCRVALQGALSNGPKQPTSRGSRRRACPDRFAAHPPWRSTRKTSVVGVLSWRPQNWWSSPENTCITTFFARLIRLLVRLFRGSMLPKFCIFTASSLGTNFIMMSSGRFGKSCCSFTVKARLRSNIKGFTSSGFLRKVRTIAIFRSWCTWYPSSHCRICRPSFKDTIGHPCWTCTSIWRPSSSRMEHWFPVHCIVKSNSDWHNPSLWVRRFWQENFDALLQTKPWRRSLRQSHHRRLSIRPLHHIFAGLRACVAPESTNTRSGWPCSKFPIRMTLILGWTLSDFRRCVASCRRTSAFAPFGIWSPPVPPSPSLYSHPP